MTQGHSTPSILDWSRRPHRSWLLDSHRRRWRARETGHPSIRARSASISRLCRAPACRWATAHSILVASGLAESDILRSLPTGTRSKAWRAVYCRATFCCGCLCLTDAAGLTARTPLRVANCKRCRESAQERLRAQSRGYVHFVAASCLASQCSALLHQAAEQCALQIETLGASERSHDPHTNRCGARVF